jgi:hypothetical protein
VTTPTPLEQIDELLVAWGERLRRMDENLVALESEAIYQILAGKAGKRPTLEGVTRERVSPALDAVTELFENRERLEGIVDKAREVRASISALTFWESDAKIAEIHKLLRGASIDLGHRVIALGERSLLDQSYQDVLVAPEQLLAEMVQRFGSARTVLLSVSHAWESLDPVMTEIEAEMTALRQLAREAHPPQEARGPFTGEPPKELTELAEAEAELARLRTRVAKDPLGVEGGVWNGIKPHLVALRVRLDAARAARARVHAMLDDARALYQQLGEAHARAVRLVDEARRELEGPSVQRLPGPLDEPMVLGLAEWLHKLEGTVAARRWTAAEIGLTRWREAADQQRTSEASTGAQAETLLAKRGELGGRLSARRAQAAALAARGKPLEPAAEARAHEADALLRRRPAPIDEAARAVEEYEAAITLATRR